jgi:hypothetical protein
VNEPNYYDKQHNTFRGMLANLTYPLYFVVFGLGIGVSFVTHDWHWFSRSGSLIVAISIAMFATNYETVVKRSIVRDLKTAQRIGVDAMLMRVPIKGAQENENTQAQIEELQRLANVVAHLANSRDVKKEVSWFDSAATTIAIAGTVIWGFGDLVGKLFV